LTPGHQDRTLQYITENSNTADIINGYTITITLSIQTMPVYYVPIYSHNRNRNHNHNRLINCGVKKEEKNAG